VDEMVKTKLGKQKKNLEGRLQTVCENICLMYASYPAEERENSFIFSDFFCFVFAVLPVC